jgi:hypothetical protein
MIVNNGSEGMWKEEIGTKLWVLFWQKPGMTEEITKNSD